MLCVFVSPQQQVRDEDEWSDDDPDPLLQHHYQKPYIQDVKNGSDNDEEDSLGNGGGAGDAYGSLDDEMELALFGELQRSGGIKKQAPHAQTTSSAVHSNQYEAQGAGKVFISLGGPSGHSRHNKGDNSRGVIRTGGNVGKSSANNNDDAASDCSDLTVDSMNNNKAQGNRNKYNDPSAVKKAITRSSVMNPTPPIRSASKLPRPNSRGVYIPGEVVAPRVQVPLPSGFQQTPSFNYAQQQQSQPQQQQVQFASNFEMVPLPAEINRSGGNNSNGTPSPTRSKGKPIYKKLKPIPISQPYHPVHNPM